MDRIFIPYVKISPTRISQYSVCENKNPGRNIVEQHDGINIISKQSRKALNEKIKWFCYCSKVRKYWNLDVKKWCYMKIAFITLTLPCPQSLSDQDIKKRCLNHFLTVMREKYKIRQYIWRAETQSCGRIHFHILINKYWYWRDIRNLWNHVLNCNNLLDYYKEKYGHDDPPSVDIMGLKRIRNIENYLTKYLTKDFADLPGTVTNDPETNVYMNGSYDILSHKRCVEGKKYGCCSFLYKIKDFIQIETNKFSEFLSKINIHFKSTLKCFDFCCVWDIRPEHWKVFSPDIYQIFNENIKKIWTEEIPALYLPSN